VGGITVGDHFLQMPILRLDDLISGPPAEFEATWPTQLLTCHHLMRFLLIVLVGPPSTFEDRDGISQGYEGVSVGASSILIDLGRIPHAARSGF
jgi:hypothetical protein